MRAVAQFWADLPTEVDRPNLLLLREALQLLGGPTVEEAAEVAEERVRADGGYIDDDASEHPAARLIGALAELDYCDQTRVLDWTHERVKRDCGIDMDAELANADSLRRSDVTPFFRVLLDGLALTYSASRPAHMLAANAKMSVPEYREFLSVCETQIQRSYWRRTGRSLGHWIVGFRAELPDVALSERFLRSWRPLVLLELMTESRRRQRSRSFVNSDEVRAVDDLHAPLVSVWRWTIENFSGRARLPTSSRSRRVLSGATSRTACSLLTGFPLVAFVSPLAPLNRCSKTLPRDVPGSLGVQQVPSSSARGAGLP